MNVSNSSNSSTKSIPMNLIHAAERSHPTVFQSTLLSAVLRAPVSTSATTTESMQLSACTQCLNPWVVGVSVRVRVVRKLDRRRFVNSVVYKCLHCEHSLSLPAARRGALKAAHAGSRIASRPAVSKKRPIVKTEQKSTSNSNSSNPTVKRPRVAAHRQQLPQDKISAAVRRVAPPTKAQSQKPAANKQPSLLSQFLSKL